MFKSFQASFSPREALQEAQQRAGVIKINAGFLREKAETSGLSAGIILGKACSDVREHRDRIAALANTPGLGDLSVEVGFDVEAGMQAIIAACDNVLSCIATSMPTGPDGWLAVQRFENGELVHRTLTPPELAGLIQELKKIEALID